jgi:ribonuclease P protein component
MHRRTALGRLARDAEYREIYREGVRYPTTHLVVYARANTLDTVRLGVVVGKRFGRAAARNRLRRRLREAVRSLAEEIQPGVDIILTPRAGIAEVSHGVLLAAVKSGLGGADVLVRGTGQR